MSKTEKGQKKYDGTQDLFAMVLGDSGIKAQFCVALYEENGGNLQVFERNGLGAKLEVATTATIVALNRAAGRISGVISRTGNIDPHVYAKALAKLATGELMGEGNWEACTDMGHVALTTWYESISLGNPDTPRINDSSARKFLVNGAKAIIEASGYTIDQILEHL